MTNRPIKAVFINHSDIHGGAAVVTYRLMHALRNEGVDASMIVMTKYTSDPYIYLPSSRLHRGWSFLMERWGIFRHNGFVRDSLFKVSTASTGIGLTKNKLVKEADVVILSWINQGLMSLKDIHRLQKMGKKIIWIMHDMWCFTGICHHSLDCRNYTLRCGNCRFLGLDRAPNDLSNRVWERKRKLYDNSEIIFVPVSNWLKDRANESLLLKKQRIEVIPNAFPVETFKTNVDESAKPFGMSKDKRYILMGAARLDDPIKGLPYAIEALNMIFDENPAIANTTEVIFFGELKDPNALENLRFPHRHVGLIRDGKVLRNMYASGTVVVSSSLFETLPGTLIEGQAAGCVPVTFGRGGQRDIVKHLKNGYIAEYKNPRSLAEGIIWALSQPISRENLHDQIDKSFSSKVVARRYMRLFYELTGIGMND
ncbi:MAG: glycosyltransferase [Bacteroides sp.]|nr:glycosyltransferase [Bacteroides sp.]